MRKSLLKINGGFESRLKSLNTEHNNVLVPWAYYWAPLYPLTCTVPFPCPGILRWAGGRGQLAGQATSPPSGLPYTALDTITMTYPSQSKNMQYLQYFTMYKYHGIHVLHKSIYNGLYYYFFDSTFTCRSRWQCRGQDREYGGAHPLPRSSHRICACATLTPIFTGVM